MARSVPTDAERFGWNEGDLDWQAEGEGEPLFSEEELDQHLAANPVISKAGAAGDRKPGRLRRFLHIHRRR
jgi:hypothetical protein